MQPDSEAPAREPETKPALRDSRAAAWTIVALLAVGAVAGSVWGVKMWRDSQAMANVEKWGGVPRPAAPRPAASAAPAPAALPRGVQNSPLAASQDRLPPLALPGQRVPDAVLRDLPDWIATEIVPPAPPARPAAASGGSADESAAVPPRAPSRPVERPRERASATFARCPGPGESGAVECRRAICAGAARKTAACVPYRD